MAWRNGEPVESDASAPRSMMFESPPPSEFVPAPAKAQAVLPRPRILIVDDDEGCLRLARKILADDYEIVLAHDGQEGLQAAMAAPPDLILSDINMPRMSGENLLRAVREQPELAEVPFIVLTAMEDQQVRLDLLRDGAQDFLVKPFLLEELRVRVSNLVKVKIARDLLQAEVDSRSSDIVDLVAEVARRRALLQFAQEQAQQASRAKSDFLMLVSHEFKTPLAVLRLTTDVWQRRASEAGLANERELERFAGSIARLESLVNGLLEAARVQRGRIEIKLEELDLNTLVQQLAVEFEAQVQAKGLTLKIDVADDARRVRSDARLVWLILSNLLMNAIKYTDAGEIAVRVYRSNGTVLEVRDAGRGIRPEDTERIFGSFVHLERLENKSTPGVGIGLSLVRDLAAALGATVGVRSEVGVGSTFTVTLQ